MQAFKPRRFIFLHCCANCEYSKKVMSGKLGEGTGYNCTINDNVGFVPGNHICSVERTNDGIQLSWFEDERSLLRS